MLLVLPNAEVLWVGAWLHAVFLSLGCSVLPQYFSAFPQINRDTNKKVRGLPGLPGKSPVGLLL